MCGAGTKESVNDALAGYVSDFYGDGGQVGKNKNSELDTAFSQNFSRNPEEKSANFDLSKYGTDLTQKARDGKLDPVIGRGKETERVIQVLCRRTKNNPVLIGEPGVGKSAVVDGLA